MSWDAMATPDDIRRDLADQYSATRRAFRAQTGGILTRDEHAAVEWGVASGRRMVLAALERYDDGPAPDPGHGESVPLDPSAQRPAEPCENASQARQDRFCGAFAPFVIVTTSLAYAALLPVLGASAAIGWIVARLGHMEATR